MLARYSGFKEEIIRNNVHVTDLTLALSKQQDTVRKLEEHIEIRLKDNKAQIEKECKELLNRELEQAGSSFDYDYRILEQFKSEQLKKIAQIKFEIDNNSVVDTEEFDSNKRAVGEVFDKISESVLKYIEPSKLQAFRGVGYGLDLINEDPEDLKAMLEYFDGYDDYDQLSKGIVAVDDRVKKISNELLMAGSLIILAVLYTYKVVLILPYLLFIMASLIIRLRSYYYLVRLINAHLLLQDRTVLMDETYSSIVDEHIMKEENRLSESRLFLEQMCDKVSKLINKSKAVELKNVERDFDLNKARENAEKTLMDSTERTKETLEEEKEKLIERRKELEDMIKIREDNIRDMKELKLEIKRVYEELVPSFKETSILTEFFLGFDDEDEPVTFDYKGASTLILYDGSLGGQVKAVMSTLKMMCGQIMTSMYPLAYSMTIVDTLTSGAPLSAFQVTGEDEDMGSSDLFEVVSTNTDATKFIDNLYHIMQTRRVKILGKHKDISEFNEEKKKFGAKTMPYKVAFFYHFDYKLLHTNDKLKQICRLSEVLGVIPIFFMDFNSVGESDKANDSQKYKYKSEVILDTLELFDNNTFGFTITDSVDIVKLDDRKINRMLNRR